MFAGAGIENGFGNIKQAVLGFDGADFEGDARHTVDQRRALVLTERDASGPTHREQAVGAVAAHAGKNGADGARRDGEIRTDLDPAVVKTLIEHTAHAIARVQPPSQDLADAYLAVLLDGLRPAS